MKKVEKKEAASQMTKGAQKATKVKK